MLLEGQSDQVSMENLGRLTKWFGAAKTSSTNLLEKLQRTLGYASSSWRGVCGCDLCLLSILLSMMYALINIRMDWFHGDIDRQASESLLSGFTKKRGTFLVRLSTTEPIRYCPLAPHSVYR